ncbi:MAG TPA: hypothetical protein VE616_04680 [Candidatus Udaeobacter sp.]|nr:hypothetical protein [Candidatus Udaeobacter sp.]
MYRKFKPPFFLARAISPDRGVVNFRSAQEVVAADVAKHTADMPLDIETLAGIRPVLDLLAKRS